MHASCVRINLKFSTNRPNQIEIRTEMSILINHINALSMRARDAVFLDSNVYKFIGGIAGGAKMMALNERWNSKRKRAKHADKQIRLLQSEKTPPTKMPSWNDTITAIKKTQNKPNVFLPNLQFRMSPGLFAGRKYFISAVTTQSIFTYFYFALECRASEIKWKKI